MSKPRALVALVPLLPALLLTACGTEGGRGPGSGAGTVSPDLPLTGTHWTVDKVTVGGSASDAPDDAGVAFEKDGRVVGRGGCNTFNATVAVKGDTLTATPGPMTEIACSEDRMRFEKELVKAFSGELKGTLRNDRLTLTSPDGRNVLALTAERPAPLRGTAWKVDGLLSGKTASSLPAGSEGKARIVLGEDGKVTGNLGCNNFSATAKADATTLTVEGPAATTRMMCTGPQMKLETRLYELLDGPLTYRIDHRTLTLTDASGEGLTATAEPAGRA
ncbi:META domain-containing protein [Streptomyces sp. NPDC000963]|uniref:META domain-containing protein n=1 Tax=Streptomyces sp. NPDC007872 TaxID=3364782 RepID=UPI001395288E|nr:META domain-containing protein [Streptomyces sp. SID2131]